MPLGLKPIKGQNEEDDGDSHCNPLLPDFSALRATELEPRALACCLAGRGTERGRGGGSAGDGRHVDNRLFSPQNIAHRHCTDCCFFQKRNGP